MKHAKGCDAPLEKLLFLAHFLEEKNENKSGFLSTSFGNFRVMNNIGVNLFA